MSTKLKLIGVDVASFGDPFIEEPNCRTVRYENKAKGVYKRINVSNDGKELLGGILIGDAEQYNMLLQTCKNKTILPPDLRGFDPGFTRGRRSMPERVSWAYPTTR